MAYGIANALFQWEEGHRTVRQAPGLERSDLEDAVDHVLDELRRRLGSSFRLGELTGLYAAGVDWAEQLARARRAGTDTAAVVDAAFHRYAIQASDYAGGRLFEGDATAGPG